MVEMVVPPVFFSVLRPSVTTCVVSFFLVPGEIREKILTLYYTIMTFNDLYKKPFENNVGKGENAGNHHFPLFPTLFSTQSRTTIIVVATQNLSSVTLCPEFVISDTLSSGFTILHKDSFTLEKVTAWIPT